MKYVFALVIQSFMVYYLPTNSDKPLKYKVNNRIFSKIISINVSIPNNNQIVSTVQNITEVDVIN